MGYILVKARIEKKDASELKTVLSFTEAIRIIKDYEDDRCRFIDKYNEWSNHCQEYLTLLNDFKRNNAKLPSQRWTRTPIKLCLTFFIFMNLFQSISAKKESFLYVTFALYLIPLVLHTLILILTESYLAIDKVSRDAMDDSIIASGILRNFNAKLKRTYKKLNIQETFEECQINLIDDSFINNTLKVNSVKQYIFSVKHCNSIVGFVLSVLISLLLHVSNVRLTFEVLASMSSLLLLLIASVEMPRVFVLREKRTNLSLIKSRTESFVRWFENCCSLRTALQELDNSTGELLKPFHIENFKSLNLGEASFVLCLFLVAASDKLDCIVSSGFSELIFENLLNRKCRWKEKSYLNRQNSGQEPPTKYVVVRKETESCNKDLKSDLKSGVKNGEHNTSSNACSSSNESMQSNDLREIDKPLENKLEKTIKDASPLLEENKFSINNAKNESLDDQVLNDDLISNDIKKLENGSIKGMKIKSYKQKTTQDKNISDDFNNSKCNLKLEHISSRKNARTKQLIIKEEKCTTISPLQLLSVGKLSPVPKRCNSLLNEKQEETNALLNQNGCESNESKKLHEQYIFEKIASEMGIINANKTYLHDESSDGLVKDKKSMELTNQATYPYSAGTSKQQNKTLRRYKNKKKYCKVKSADSQNPLTFEEEEYFHSKNRNEVNESGKSFSEINTDTKDDSQNIYNSTSSESLFKIEKTNVSLKPMKTQNPQLPLVTTNGELNGLQESNNSPQYGNILRNLSELEAGEETLSDSNENLNAAVTDTHESKIIQESVYVDTGVHLPKYSSKSKSGLKSDAINHREKHDFTRRKVSKKLLKLRGLLHSDLNGDQNLYKSHESSESSFSIPSNGTNDARSHPVDLCSKTSFQDISGEDQNVTQKNEPPEFRRPIFCYPPQPPLDPPLENNKEGSSKDFFGCKTSKFPTCRPKSHPSVNKDAETKRRKKKNPRTTQSRDVFTSSGMDNESECSVLPIDTSEDGNFHFHQCTKSDPSVEEEYNSNESFQKKYYGNHTGTRPIMWNDNSNAFEGQSSFFQQHLRNEHSPQPLRYRLVYDNVSLDFVDDSENVSVRFFCESGDEGEEIPVSSSKVGCTQTDDQQVFVDGTKTSIFNDTVDVCCDTLPLSRSFEVNGHNLLMAVEKSAASGHRDSDTKTDDQSLAIDHDISYYGNQELNRNVPNIINSTAFEIEAVENDSMYHETNHNESQNDYNSAFNSLFPVKSNAELGNIDNKELSVTNDGRKRYVSRNDPAPDSLNICDSGSDVHPKEIFCDGRDYCINQNNIRSMILEKPVLSVSVNDSSRHCDNGSFDGEENLNNLDVENYNVRNHDLYENTEMVNEAQCGDFPKDQFSNIDSEFPTLLSEPDSETSSSELYSENNDDQPPFDINEYMNRVNNQVLAVEDNDDADSSVSSVSCLCDSNCDEHKANPLTVNAEKYEVSANDDTIFFQFSDMKCIESPESNQKTSVSCLGQVQGSIDEISGLKDHNECSAATSNLNQSTSDIKPFPLSSEQIIAICDETASSTEFGSLKCELEASCAQTRKTSVSVVQSKEVKEALVRSSSATFLTANQCKYVSRGDVATSCDLTYDDETVKYKNGDTASMSQDDVHKRNVHHDDIIDRHNDVINKDAQRTDVSESNAQHEVQNNEVKINSEENEGPLDFRLNAKPLYFEAGDLKLNFCPKTKSGAVKVEFKKKPGLKHLTFKSNCKRLSVKIGQNYYQQDPYSYQEDYGHGEPEC